MGRNMAFEAADPGFAERVRESFARQQVMRTLGATLAAVAPGEVRITMPFRLDLTQQHGYLHAGIGTTILDSACGYAAFSLMSAGAGVLTVEYKVNFLSPAQGDSFLAHGRVVKPGRTLMVCAGDLMALRDGQERAVATMLATLMVVRDRPDITD
jgi:uncharacterized protein (TIGR00369 family)